VSNASEIVPPATEKGASEAGGSGRPNPVALTALVRVTGARQGGEAGSRDLFTEDTQTVLVFKDGAVIRLSAGVTIGQLLYLTLKKNGKEVVCQVLRKRNYKPTICYVELQFTEEQANFWGVAFPEGKRGGTDFKLMEHVQAAETTADDKGAPVAPRSAEDVEALKKEVEALRQQLKELEKKNTAETAAKTAVEATKAAEAAQMTFSKDKLEVAAPEPGPAEPGKEVTGGEWEVASQSKELQSSMWGGEKKSQEAGSDQPSAESVKKEEKKTQDPPFPQNHPGRQERAKTEGGAPSVKGNGRETQSADLEEFAVESSPVTEAEKNEEVQSAELEVESEENKPQDLSSKPEGGAAQAGTFSSEKLELAATYEPNPKSEMKIVTDDDWSAEDEAERVDGTGSGEKKSQEAISDQPSAESLKKDEKKTQPGKEVASDEWRVASEEKKSQEAISNQPSADSLKKEEKKAQEPGSGTEAGAGGSAMATAAEGPLMPAATDKQEGRRPVIGMVLPNRGGGANVPAEMAKDPMEDLLPKPELDFSKMPQSPAGFGVYDSRLLHGRGRGLSAKAKLIGLVAVVVLGLAGGAWYGKVWRYLPAWKRGAPVKADVAKTGGVVATPTASAGTNEAPGTAVNPETTEKAPEIVSESGAGSVNPTAGSGTGEVAATGSAGSEPAAATKKLAEVREKTRKKEEAASSQQEEVKPVEEATEAALIPARLMRAVQPVYPPDAMLNYITGDVKAELVIEASGRVGEVRVISGPKALRDAAVEALKQYQYAPATKGGKAVESKTTETVKFWFNP